MSSMDKSKQLLDDDARFDRLVDGELPADEYKSLVASLDDEPGGWRRCATAFLEAQALGHELGAIRQGGQLVDTKPQPASVAMNDAKPAAHPARWNLLLAMSASFLVAFILGVTLPDLWNPAAGPVVEGPRVAVQPAIEDAQDDLPRTIGNARLVLDGPGGTQSTVGDVPIYELPGDAASWLSQTEPALSAELINELERRGHRVRREQQYVPVNLEDGREGLIPVESYQITPVSRRAY